MFWLLEFWLLDIICDLMFEIWDFEQNAKSVPAEVKHLIKRRNRE